MRFTSSKTVIYAVLAIMFMVPVCCSSTSASEGLSGISDLDPDRVISSFTHVLLGRRPVNLVFVDKGKQRLLVIEANGRGGRVLAGYSCATGENPGKKEVSGDSRTPEGIYFITETYRDSKITVFGRRAFHLDYPNVFDRKAGRNGDGIFIHGTNRDLQLRSTNGCITMNNSDLEEVEQYLEQGVTPVIVVPTLTAGALPAPMVFPLGVERMKTMMLPGELEAGQLGWDSLYVIHNEGQTVALGDFSVVGEGRNSAVRGRARGYLDFNRETGWSMLDHDWIEVPGLEGTPASMPAYPRDEEKVMDFVEVWRQSWQTKQLATYLRCYDKSFTRNGMDLSGWRVYKERLNKQYKWIAVKISDIEVNWQPYGAMVTFRQEYDSDKYSAAGRKTLDLVYRDQAWKIRRELWRADNGKR